MFNDTQTAFDYLNRVESFRLLMPNQRAKTKAFLGGFVDLNTMKGFTRAAKGEWKRNRFGRVVALGLKAVSA